VVGARFKGEDTWHGIVVASSSNWNYTEKLQIDKSCKIIL
jgi:hypothetical protein